MISSIPTPSKKVQSFFDFVQSETGRPILLQQVPSVGLKGMNFAFQHDPTRIIIKVVLPFRGSIDQFEQSLAHEAGHGLLTYSKGYIHIEPRSDIEKTISFSLSLIGTMIDDVPVNRVIQDYGFNPCGKIYISMVKKEAKAARQRNMSIYDNTGPDEITQKRFMTYRYVAAWSYLQYFKMISFHRDAMKKFRKNFRRAYPDLAEEGLKICNFFREHDVFSTVGHEHLVKEVLSLWDLNNYLSLKRYS
jgi:hypothetical protein